MRVWFGHGRDSSTEEMSDWGYDGPTLYDVHSVEQMYGETTTVRFTSTRAQILAREITGWEVWDEVALEVREAQGLIEIRGRQHAAQYFADFGVVMDGDDCRSRKRRESDPRSQLRMARRSIEDALKSLDDYASDAQLQRGE